MTKLPINFLLYVASLGLAGGSGLFFYEALKIGRDREAMDRRQLECKQLIENGYKRAPDSIGQGAYVPPDFWKAFKDVNFIGTLPPPPAVEKPVEQPKPQEVGMPINDILTVIGIVYDGPRSKAIVRYKPGANVQVPPELVPLPRVAGRDVTPVPQPGGKAGSPMPAYDLNATPMHHVLLEQTLWKPHNPIRLVKVDEDARTVWFQREDPQKPKEQWKQERVEKNELDLAPDVLRMLGQKMPEKTGTGTQAQASAGADGGHWTDPPETVMVSPGEYQISRKDNLYLEENANRLLGEEVEMMSYSSKSGQINGVMLRRVGELSKYGMQDGDLLISLNGVPVKNKAEAIQVGKDQYRKGRRTFTAIYQRRGENLSQTYHFADR